MAKEENAAEEAHAEGDLGTASSKTTKASREKTANTLSNISKNYDLDGDGKLDETEMMMMKYDKNGDGTLDMREVHKIVRDLLVQQKELENERKTILNMKKLIICLVVFAKILTLAMLGVSFAAAVIAKDTRADSVTSSFTDKNTNKALSTVGSARGTNYEMFLNGTESGRRSLLAPNLPFAWQGFRRHTGEEGENEGDRSLQTKDDDVNSGDDDKDDDLTSRAFDDDEVIADCIQMKGKISKRDFYDIYDAWWHRDNFYSFLYEDGDWEIMETMYFDRVWSRRGDDQMVVLSKCDYYYFFDCNKGSKSNCDPDEECCSSNCCDFSVCDLNNFKKD